MCCFLQCCSIVLDFVQRVITVVLAMLMCFIVCLGLVTAVAAGIAYGYNYSMSEFLTYKRHNMSVYVRRGVFHGQPQYDRDVPVSRVHNDDVNVITMSGERIRNKDAEDQKDAIKEQEDGITENGKTTTSTSQDPTDEGFSDLLRQFLIEDNKSTTSPISLFQNIVTKITRLTEQLAITKTSSQKELDFSHLSPSPKELKKYFDKLGVTSPMSKSVSPEQLKDASPSPTKLKKYFDKLGVTSPMSKSVSPGQLKDASPSPEELEYYDELGVTSPMSKLIPPEQLEDAGPLPEELEYYGDLGVTSPMSKLIPAEQLNDASPSPEELEYYGKLGVTSPMSKSVSSEQLKDASPSPKELKKNFDKLGVTSPMSKLISPEQLKHASLLSPKELEDFDELDATSPMSELISPQLKHASLSAKELEDFDKLGVTKPMSKSTRANIDQELRDIIKIKMPNYYKYYADEPVAKTQVDNSETLQLRLPPWVRTDFSKGVSMTEPLSGLTKIRQKNSTLQHVTHSIHYRNSQQTTNDVARGDYEEEYYGFKPV